MSVVWSHCQKEQRNPGPYTHIHSLITLAQVSEKCPPNVHPNMHVRPSKVSATCPPGHMYMSVPVPRKCPAQEELKQRQRNLIPWQCLLKYILEAFQLVSAVEGRRESCQREGGCGWEPLAAQHVDRAATTQCPHPALADGPPGTAWACSDVVWQRRGAALRGPCGRCAGCTPSPDAGMLQAVRSTADRAVIFLLVELAGLFRAHSMLEGLL